MSKKFPKITGETGNITFEFENGKKSKSIYATLDFQEDIASYPILNNNKEIVEYMDIAGNFSKEPTKFALELFNYVFFENYHPLLIRTSTQNFYYCALLSFPSKYLINKNVLKYIEEEERNKFKTLCANKEFTSLLEMLKYKLYVKRCLKQKLERAEQLKAYPEIVEEVQLELE